jgi:hypothetical protein
MIKIVGIGRCGNNILEFIKKQSIQIKKDLKYQFISVNDDDSLNNIKISSGDIIFTVAGYGGSKGSTYTEALTKKVIGKNIEIKNFIILPFLFEGKEDIVNHQIEQLFSINQNVELFPNDELLTKSNQDKKIPELMREYDVLIFNRITNEKQVKWRNFITKHKVKNKTYKMVVTFWSKDYKITLIEPIYKIIDSSHMLHMTPSRFAFKDEDKSISSIQDIEKIANNVLINYIKKEKS